MFGGKQQALTERKDLTGKKLEIHKDLTLSSKMKNQRKVTKCMIFKIIN